MKKSVNETNKNNVMKMIRNKLEPKIWDRFDLIGQNLLGFLRIFRSFFRKKSGFEISKKFKNGSIINLGPSSNKAKKIKLKIPK